MSTRGRWVTRALVGALLPVVGAATGAAQTTERVSVSSAGVRGNGQSGPASIAADGRFVAFSSLATSLVSGDTNGVSDVFMRGPIDGCLFCDDFEYGDTSAWSSTSP